MNIELIFSNSGYRKAAFIRLVKDKNIGEYWKLMRECLHSNLKVIK